MAGAVREGGKHRPRVEVEGHCHQKVVAARHCRLSQGAAADRMHPCWAGVCRRLWQGAGEDAHLKCTAGELGCRLEAGGC